MKAAVTGWAWRTPLGSTVEDAVRRLLAGERAATDRLRIDTQTYRCRLGAPVPGDPIASPLRKFLPRMALFGVEAGREACEHAGARGDERLGLFAAVGGLRVYWDDTMPALETQRSDGAGCWDRGLRRLHPFWLLRHLSNNGHALLSAELRARGEGLTCAGANAGAQALCAALRALEAGAVDAALVVGYDSLLDPEALVELAAAGLATESTLAELRAPYDEAAAGVVPGEAAAALLLEPAGRAGARALAFLGAAEGSDGGESTPSSEALARVAGPLARGAAVVDGAALARPAFDAQERAQLAALAAPGARLVATAAAFGQLGAAAPLVQAIALAACLRHGRLPPIAALGNPGAGPLAPVVARAVETAERAAVGVTVGAPGLVGVVRVELP